MNLFKRFIALVLVLTFTSGAFANTQLETVIDDYQYFVTVEWDQKDMKHLEAATAYFQEELAEMIHSGTISKEDVLALAEKRMGNKEKFQTLKKRIELMGNNGDPRVLGEVLTEVSSGFYATGANWSDDAVGMICGVLVVAVVVWGVVSLSK